MPKPVANPRRYAGRVSGWPRSESSPTPKTLLRIGRAAAAPLAFLHACLGVKFLPELEEIQLHSPTLPRLIERLEIHGLRMGEGAIDLVIHGSGSDLAMQVPSRHGQIKAMMIQEP